MAKWNTESGILRKKCAPEKLEDLLVFGYACKLFRDDEKAQYIDQGKHLIPWMGDEKLRIDRYDCRGALSDLTPYESSREGYDAMRWLGLNESERKIEQLCDEERYYSLNANEEEETMYKEEVLKRLQQKTKEFAYSYDVPQDPDGPQASDAPTVEEDDREYVPAPELHVPSDIAIPSTVKENTRIEKTALFVSKQGPQMEILIKAKQSDNPQFSFLNQADPFYKYYKHVLSAIKAGSYKVETTSKEEPKKEEAEQDGGDGYYLHPSLQISVQSPMMTQVPIVSYKPTADCAYSQLVNRIQGSQTESAKPEATSGQHNQVTSYEQQQQQQQQYYQYYYAMQYYEYYKQMAAQFHSLGDTDGQTIPPHVQEQFNAQAAAFAQMAYTQYVQQQQQNTNNPYAQIVSNLSHNKDTNVPSYPPMPPMQDAGNISKAPVIYSHEETEPIEPKKALQSLINYGSDTDDSTDADKEDVKIPPDDTKVIVDKMASYVSKNGTDFENIVRAKGDVRFNFLHETHEYYAYYKLKITEFAGTSKTKPETNGLTKTKEKKLITPVSFSIKKPKEESTKDIKNALPVEETDDDDDNTETVPDVVASTSATEETVVDQTDVDPILEMIDLTDDIEERKDARRAEDKIKDKLAAAAREKLALANKDRALQLERKKKAAAFLKLKSVETTKRDKILVISDSENKCEYLDEKTYRRPKSKTRDKYGKRKAHESEESEEGEIKKHRKSGKKKHSHKRKHSKSRHECRSHQHKKSRKRRKRSDSKSSAASSAS